MNPQSTCWYDEKTGITHQKNVGPQNATDTRASMEHLMSVLQDKPRALVLVDVREAPTSMSDDVKHVVTEYSARIKMDKQAFVIANPLARMLAKVLIKVSGAKHPTNFFGTVEAAEKWLLEK